MLPQVKVIAFYEDHWMPPGTDHAQWDHLCRAYGAELQMVRDWNDAVTLEDSWVCLLDENGLMDLAELGDIDIAIANSEAGVMPDKFTLIFGRTAQDLMTAIPAEDWNYAFRITTPEAVPMFGVNACAIALFALEQWVKIKMMQAAQG
jgi:hypothetical protein